MISLFYRLRFSVGIIFLLFSTNVSAVDVFNSTGFTEEKNDKIAAHEEVFDILDETNISDRAKGRVIILNKITASSREFDIAVGKSVTFGRVSLELHKCASSEHKGSLMLVSLNIEEKRHEKKQIFRGWLFAESPSLSAVEHPVYQLIAVNCL